MNRRIVSLLLLLCSPLTQSVSGLGHSHGDNQPVGHDLGPHFHANRAVARHHPHTPVFHHGHDGHRHHNHQEGDAPGAATSSPEQRPDPLSPDQHDSDAIFIDRVEVIVSKRSTIDDPFGGLEACAMATAFRGNSRCDVACRQAVNWTPARPPRGDACPLYLRLLSLLI